MNSKRPSTHAAASPLALLRMRDVVDGMKELTSS
jgi:hypothetical protein